MKPLLAGLLIVLPLLGAIPAAAQVETREEIALQNQILELRHDLQVLRDQVARGGGGGSALGAAAAPPASSGDMVAALLDRVSRLEDEVRTLRGQLDETNNALQQQNADLSKKIADLDFKLGIDTGDTGTPPPADGTAPAAGPSGAGPTPIAPAGGAPAPGPGTAATVPMSPPPGMLGAPVPPTPPVPPPPPPVRRTPEMAMQQGNAALARRDYAAAEADAREILAGPRTPRSTDAQFLLAEALAGKRDYQGAAVAYDDAYNRGPTGVHAQDALVGLASSLASLNAGRAACATLDKLKAQFPNPRQDLRGPIAGIRQRAGCH